jgi:hypothetical protein
MILFKAAFSSKYEYLFLDFITEEKMLWHTYLYESIMFTNKMRCSIIGKKNAQEAEGKERGSAN